MQTAAFDAEVHHAFIDQLRGTGCAPSRHGVSAALARPVNEIEQALRRLSAGHSVVLHPHVCEPWVIHPFSLSPTATWVQQGEQGWWAPCIWCGFGIAALAGSRTWAGVVRASLRSKLAQMVRCRGCGYLRKSRLSRAVLEFGKPRRQFLSHAGGTKGRRVRSTPIWPLSSLFQRSCLGT